MAVKDLLSQIEGHKAVVERLKVAARKRLAPTLLFVGPSGVGKRRVARGLVQLLVCETGAKSACGVCGPCVRVAKNQSESLLEVEPQGAGIKIEQTRQIVKFVELAHAGARAVIMNDAHLLNAHAANSLLKTLEEPPERTWFFLIAPSAAAVLPTIRSRSQVIRFGALPKDVIQKLTQADSWMIASAMGRLDLLEDLGKEEVTALRVGAFDFWRGHAEGLHDLLSSREAALWVTRFWQGLIRDSLFYKKSLSPLIHADQLELIEEVAKRNEQDLARLGHELSRLERDIQHNADYHLAFENFVRNRIDAAMD